MFTTMLTSKWMSNTAATAVVMAAIAPLPVAMGSRPGIVKALLLGIPIAATLGSLGTILGTPPNAITYSTGLLEQRDFRMGGILISLPEPMLGIL